MKESNEINLPRYGRVLGAANAAARQTPGALVRCAENSEAFVNTVQLTVPSGSTVYYTTDCTEPTQSSTLYTGPITIASNTVVRAAAGSCSPEMPMAGRPAT